MKTIKLGQMPGKIQEVAVEQGTTVAQAIEIAGLDTQGFDVKVDGNTITDLSTTVDNANTILLVKMIKGNSEMIKIGQMPGKIQEYAFEQGTTIREAIETAGLDTNGFDVKVDGSTVTELDNVIQGSTILLVRQIKGNSGGSTVKIGQMPGKIQEYAFEDGTTISEAIATAGLEVSGYDVKADGNTITDLDTPVDSISTLLLVRQIKGNSNTVTVKVGQMPGKIQEYVVEQGATIEQAIELAELDTQGFDVKVNGNTVTDLSTVLTDPSVVLLVRQIKGNA